MDTLPTEIVDVIISFRGEKMTEQEFKLARSLNRQWKTFFEKKLFIYEQYDKKIFSIFPPKRNNDFVKIKGHDETLKGVLYRREYHTFSQGTRDLILEKTNKVGVITFDASPFNIYYFSATLFTKYLLDEKCYSSRPKGYEGSSKYFFDIGKIFELSNGNIREGKLVKGRYPNHYDVFSLIYEDKLGSISLKRLISENVTQIREYGSFTPEMSDSSDESDESNEGESNDESDSDESNEGESEGIVPVYYSWNPKPAGNWDGESWGSSDESDEEIPKELGNGKHKN